MKISDCWEAASSFIVNGDTTNAIALCETEQCSASLACQKYLGWTYFKQGEMEKALNWYARAAEGGDAEAMYGIASVYFNLKDFQSALQHFERAASTGIARSYHWLGYMYLNGLGVPQDDRLGVHYYEKGAAHGYILAKRVLLHLTFKHGGLLTRIAAAPNYVYLFIKAAVLAYRNINDERLADIPNVFQPTTGFYPIACKIKLD